MPNALLLEVPADDLALPVDYAQSHVPGPGLPAEAHYRHRCVQFWQTSLMCQRMIWNG